MGGQPGLWPVVTPQEPGILATAVWSGIAVIDTRDDAGFNPGQDL